MGVSLPKSIHVIFMLIFKWPGDFTPDLGRGYAAQSNLLAQGCASPKLKYGFLRMRALNRDARSLYGNRSGRSKSGGQTTSLSSATETHMNRACVTEPEKAWWCGGWGVIFLQASPWAGLSLWWGFRNPRLNWDLKTHPPLACVLALNEPFYSRTIIFTVVIKLPD